MSTLMLAFLWLLNFFSFNLFTAAEFPDHPPVGRQNNSRRSDIPALLYCFLKTLLNPEGKRGGSTRFWSSSAPLG